MSWLAQYFLNPAYVLPGAALVSVPIIIHLLSRLRYRRMRFSAMEFLLESEELNRRRLIIEQLLLLLLRIFVVILIVLLVARLVLDPSGMLLLRGATAHHVVIVDDSLSMRDRDRTDTVFERAVSVVERMLREGSYRPRAIRLTLLTTSAPDRPLVADRVLDGALLQELMPRLRNLKCSWQATSPVSALNTAAAALSADGGVTPQVHLITDFRRDDWNDRPEVVAALEDLGTIHARVNIVQVTNEGRTNHAVSEIHSDTLVTAVGTLWRMNVTFLNPNSQRATGLRATVLVDGRELPSRIQVPDLEQNSEQLVSHDLSFAAAGTHQVEVRLDDDSLMEDNRRFVAVSVAPHRSVLLVDDRGQQEDAAFVASALSPDPQLTGIVVDQRTSAILTSADLSAYDCIYLLNIRELPADAVQLLANYVRGGGGIAWFPDDQANTDWYNTTLQVENNMLFPVTLGTVAEIPEPERADLPPPFESPVFEQHPIFAVYNRSDSPFSAATLFWRWFQIANDRPPDSNVRVLARLGSGDPIVLEHSLGEGRILTFLTTAGRRWSNWPVAPALPGYVVMQLLTHAYLQKSDDSIRPPGTVEPITLEWSVDRFSDLVDVFFPDRDESASEEAATNGEAVLRIQAAIIPREDDSADADHMVVTIGQADRPGVYRVKRFTQEGEPHETWIALNVSTDESRLTLADPKMIEQLPGLEHVAVHAGGIADALSAADSGRELRWVLLGLLILVLLAEQQLSLRMSCHPETAR